jgi:hypothetical protein
MVVGDLDAGEGDGLDGWPELGERDDDVGEVLLLQRDELGVERQPPLAVAALEDGRADVRHVVEQPGELRARHGRRGLRGRVVQVRPPVRLQRGRAHLNARNLQHLHRTPIPHRRPRNSKRHRIRIQHRRRREKIRCPYHRHRLRLRRRITLRHIVLLPRHLPIRRPPRRHLLILIPATNPHSHLSHNPLNHLKNAENFRKHLSHNPLNHLKNAEKRLKGGLGTEGGCGLGFGRC